MSKETRALTTIGGKVQETKSVSVNASTLSSKSKDKDKDKGTDKSKNNDRSSKKGTEGKQLTSAAASASHAQAVHGKTSNKKRIVLGLLAVAVIGIAVVAFSFYQGSMTNTKSTEVVEQNSEQPAPHVSSAYSDEELSSIASRENIGLPRMVDKDTRLDFTVGVSDSFQYNYTLINNNSEDITFSSLTSSVEKSLVKWVCTTKSTLDQFVKKGVTISFAYFGKDRRLIGVITVEPSQCGIPNSGP